MEVTEAAAILKEMMVKAMRGEMTEDECALEGGRLGAIMTGGAFTVAQLLAFGEMYPTEHLREIRAMCTAALNDRGED